MTVWEAVVKALKAEGVRYIFGLPGNPSFLYDALHDVPEIKPIHVREESSGGFMAMCYARAGYAEGIATPGVCFASPGPGMANLIPALLEAESACLPVLAIVASESTEISGKGAFQEADQISMARPVTKWTVNITDPVKAPWAIRRAFSLMVNGRPGPVMVQIPANVGLQDAGIPEYVPAGPRIRTEADPFLVSRAVDLLLSAKRPVMVVGGGAVSSGAFEEVREICDLLGMPVLTTPCGRGCVSEDFPLALGLVGLYFTRLGEEIYSDADLLFVVGSRNEEMQSGGWKFFPKNARYVQVDIDASQIGLNWIPDVGLVGDAKLVLRQIIRAVTESDAIGQLDRTRAIEIADAKARFEAEIDKECIDESVPLKSKRIVHAIGEVFGPDTIIVKENGSQDLWAYYYPYYKVRKHGMCVAPGEQTCMGMAVSGVIGAKLRLPEKWAVCTTGDGAFQMFLKEIPTARECGAPVTWVVLDNHALGWIRFLQERYLSKRFICSTFETQPDYALIARAYGCYGEKVEKPEEIVPALRRAKKANEEGIPSVLDFIVGEEYAPGFIRFYERLMGPHQTY